MSLPRLTIARGLLVALAVVLAGRAVWQASRTEVGWEVVLDQWLKTPAAAAGLERRALAEQEPVDQARFWLRELERAPAQADVLAGAAWMLDAPQPGYLQRYVVIASPFPGLPASPMGTLDRDRIARALGEFEQRCEGPCVARIAEATDLQPDEADLWRARALLLWSNPTFSGRTSARRQDWATVLETCAAHDPDNALYDYLAALAHWSESAPVRYENTDLRLVVNNQPGLDEGNRRFAQGLEKPQLIFGSRHARFAWTFLQTSTLPRMERIKAAESCGIDERASGMILHLVRRQHEMQEIHQREGRVDEAVKAAESAMTLTAQVRREGNPPWFAIVPAWMRRSALGGLVELADDEPDLLAPERLAQARRELDDLRLEIAVMQSATERMDVGEKRDWPLLGVVAAVAQQPAELLLMVGLILLAPGYWLGTSGLQVPKARVPVHLVCWLSALAISVTLLGLCPAEIISADAQTLVVRTVAWSVCVLAPLAVVFIVKRAFGVRYREVLALAVTASAPWLIFFSICAPDMTRSLPSFPESTGILVALLSLWLVCAWLTIRVNVELFRRRDLTARRKAWLVSTLALLAMFSVPWTASAIEFIQSHVTTQVWVPPRAWAEAAELGLTPETLHDKLQHPWLWTAAQWYAYRGPVVWPSLALVFLAIYASRRSARTEGGWRELVRTGKRRYLSHLGREIARSLLLAGVLALLVYVAALPELVDRGEAYYQRHARWLADPQAISREIDAQIAAVRSDSRLMDELREKVESERLRSLATPRRRR